MAPVVRRVLIGSMAVMSIVSVAAIFIFAFQCRPLSVAWGVGTGTCLPGSTIANTAYAVSAADILFSWLYGVSSVCFWTRFSCGERTWSICNYEAPLWLTTRYFSFCLSICSGVSRSACEQSLLSLFFLDSALCTYYSLEWKCLEANSYNFGVLRSCIATILRLNYAIEVSRLPSTAAAQAVDLLLTATI